MKKALGLVVVLLITASCTTYQYHARLDVKNSVDRDVEALAYWQVTNRKLWFDTYAGAVRVKTQCSHRTLVFSEREEGIVFHWKPGLVKEDGSGDEETICGRVLGADRIKDLNGGSLKIEILCQAEIDEFSASAESAPFIAPRPTPYVFNISREKGEKPPNVAECEPSQVP
jgi:hypothetical protein